MSVTGSDGKRQLVYSFVARGTVVLADYTSYTGNVGTVAVQYLEKCPPGNTRFTFTCDTHTFNYLVDGGYTFMVVADEQSGRTLPFAFLDRIREEFHKNYGEKGKTAIAHSLDKGFGPRLRYWHEYCQDHPEEFNRVASMQKKVDEVKELMSDNIQRTLERGEQLQDLDRKADGLRFQADEFQKRGSQIRKAMWWQSMKTKLALGMVVLIVIGLVILGIYLGVK